MRRFLFLILWPASFLAALYCFFTIFTGELEVSAYVIALPLLLLLSGFSRRMFHVSKELVEENGLRYAITTRLLCRRFFWSIFLYAAVTAAVYFFNRMSNIIGTNGDGLRAILCVSVACFFFLIVRRTCPKCGHKLTFDDESGVTYGEFKWNSDIKSMSATRESTEHYHCPRCGAQVKIHAKRHVASLKNELK